ncbi:TonB-linked outer membrane protein, SusC/RagA family [Cnuella takakiae]|uniref:TonB-linked outer membrane protein, SusC/RagA family n=2 Tax=Cnuella takakiae TaxID=1302690 RepID=A0A1M5EW13_9BACT|nr:TonB-linked outer membrane protein, SusC/RagA family [Cnuella takakiae]
MMLGLLLVCLQVVAQNRTLSGRVTDAQGNGVPNASVNVKGTNVGTTTNADGTFSLSVAPSAKALVISSVGMTESEVAIGGKTNFTVQLTTDTKQLDEVVVTVPYGQVKKTAFTGSEATIGSRNLERQQVTSVTRALEGQIPGLITTNGGGQPGSNASVLVRGVGSYSASSSPLYVLDGVPYNGSISSLSTDDIASVTVLKDASAAALYGSRAANGVIMITTKKGKKGRASVTANVRIGQMSRLIPEYDRVGTPDYYELMWEATRNRFAASKNPATGANYTAAEAATAASGMFTGSSGLVYNAYNVPGAQLIDNNTGKLNPNAKLLWQDNWEKALIQNAMRQDYNVNIAGGAEKSDYFLSFGHVNEDGIAKFSGYKRFTTRLNVNTQATNWLKAGVNFDGALGNQKTVPSGGTATTNPFYYSRMMGPIYPVYQRDAWGVYVIDPVTNQPALDWGRPAQMGTRPYAGNSNLLGSLALDDRNTATSNINANSYLEAAFLKNFTFKTTLGATHYNGYATTFQNSQYGDADNVKGRSTKSNNRQTTYTFNQVLTWAKELGDHDVRVLAGHENYRFQQNFVSATRVGFPFPGTSELAPAATAEASTSYENLHAIEGYFANANYNYKGKYLLSGSYRKDGTSRFSEDSRWGDFWSVGAGWRLKQENFLRSIKWINDLKLRASYGQQGNESIGDYYAYQSLYALGWNNVSSPGAIVSTLPANQLHWENNTTANIGVDFSLFDRLQGTVEVFNRVSKDMLFDVPLPLSTGISSRRDNVGSLYNRGIELQLGYNVIRKKNFDWRIDLNGTHFVNKITKLSQKEIIDGTKKLMVGKSLYDFWIREYAGVDPQTGDALYYRDELDAAGLPTGKRVTVNNINNGSYYYHGSSLPLFNGGLTNSVRYRNLEASVLLTFSYGGKFYDGNYASLMHPGSYGTAWHTDILKRWQKPGDITDVPRIQNALATQNGVSTRYLFDGSWMNIKNVTIAYNLPKTLASRVGMSNAKVFANADNAYFFSKRKGMDPQRAVNGTADWTYIPYRTITMGLTVNL